MIDAELREAMRASSSHDIANQVPIVAPACDMRTIAAFWTSAPWHPDASTTT